MMEGFIAPGALRGLVHNTVPWLDLPAPVDGGPVEARAAGPQGFRRLLAPVPDGAPEPATGPSRADDEPLLEYFGLCLAAHHATVASFVPTDVDSKIRGLLWRRATSAASLERMWALARAFAGWDVPGVSQRTVEVAPGEHVSGHDGERLSVMAGGLGRALGLGADHVAAEARQAIERELARQAQAFVRLAATGGAEIATLGLAAALTHNAGDLDQGLSFWPRSEPHRSVAAQWGRLAHENTSPYGGAFAAAARLYKRTLAPEGHRNYPLRGVRALRQSRDLLLPIAPFLDDWGARLARHPSLTDADLAEVVRALVVGSRKLAGQSGYYRGLAGLLSRLEGARLDRIVAQLPASVRAELRSAEVRRRIAVPRVSFESSLKKIVAAGEWRRA
jgi:hypothetical protein